MNTISPSISDFGTDALDEGNTPNHRYFRSRNLVKDNADVIESSAIHGSIHFDNAFKMSIQKGLHSARRNIVPSLITFSLMALMAWAYLAIPFVQTSFNAIARFKLATGTAFSFFAMGLSVALLTEAIKVCTSKTHRWTQANTINFLSLFIFFGLLASSKDSIFLLLAKIYGEGMTPGIIVKKVFFDQFIWTLFLVCPTQALLFSWKAHGFSIKSLLSECPTFTEFFALKVVPILITSWCFWLPMAAIVYSFPTELQLIASIIATSLWICLQSIYTVKVHNCPIHATSSKGTLCSS